MKAQVQTEALNNAFKTIARLVPPESGNVTIEVKGGKQMVMRSQAPAAECSVVIPCEELSAKKDVLFAVPLDGIRTAVRGREAVNMEFDKQALRIKCGSFTADLNTIDAIEMEAIEEEGQKEKPKKWKLPAEHATWLAKAARAVALQSNSVTGVFMPISIRLDSKKAFVSCYDKNHFAFLQSKEITGDLDLTIPIETMQAILEVFQGANFSIEMYQTRIVVSNKLIRVSLAVPEIEAGSLTIDDVVHVAKEAEKMKGTDMTVPAESLKNFLDASKAVAMKERAALLGEGEDAKVKLSVQTLSGTVKEKLSIEKLKKKVGFNVDFMYFEEAVRKLNGDAVTFKVVSSEFLMFNSDNLYVLIATNQEQ